MSTFIGSGHTHIQNLCLDSAHVSALRNACSWDWEKGGGCGSLCTRGPRGGSPSAVPRKPVPPVTSTFMAGDQLRHTSLVTPAPSHQLGHTSSVTPAWSHQLRHTSLVTPAPVTPSFVTQCPSHQLRHTGSVTRAPSHGLRHTGSVTRAPSHGLRHTGSVTEPALAQIL